MIVKRRRAEVKVSTLSAEQRRELVKAKDKELNTVVKHSVVEAASRQGISPSALMNMRWAVTFEDDPNVVSNRFTPITSDFPDNCGINWFSNSPKRRDVCISSRGLG